MKTKQYAYLLEENKKMPYHTNMRIIFDSINNKQNEYNWLLTDKELNGYYPEVLAKDVVFMSGEEITKVVRDFNIQFIWGVFSGFDKMINIDINNLEVEPYSESPHFWENKPVIQHPKATIEIVCWDGSSTLFFTKKKELVNLFKGYFENAIDLYDYNRRL